MAYNSYYPGGNRWADPSETGIFKNNLQGRGASDVYDASVQQSETGIWDTSSIRNPIVRNLLDQKIIENSRGMQAGELIRQMNREKYRFGALAAGLEAQTWSMFPWKSNYAFDPKVQKRAGEKSIGAYNAISNWERAQTFADVDSDMLSNGMNFPNPKDVPRNNIWWVYPDWDY